MRSTRSGSRNARSTPRPPSPSRSNIGIAARRSGPRTFGIGGRFPKVVFPLLRYNLVFYVHRLAPYLEARANPRFRAALDARRAESAVLTG